MMMGDPSTSFLVALFVKWAFPSPFQSDALDSTCNDTLCPILELELFPSNCFIQLDVPTRQFDNKFFRSLRQFLIIVRVTIIPEPKAQKLFVDILWLFPRRNPVLV
mmetsp:Transcript_15246/g.27702  ORF Transcript_15246/g.27702 Transcript_15246/m.27702 type:complete len:106 (+) Transcript_15246:197-514(+)